MSVLEETTRYRTIFSLMVDFLDYLQTHGCADLTALSLEQMQVAYDDWILDRVA